MGERAPLTRPAPMPASKSSGPATGKSASNPTPTPGNIRVLEVLGDNSAITEAYKAVKALIDSGNFKGAAEALKQLKGATLKAVLEKLLGAAGKAASSSVTLEQLTQIVEGSIKQINQAALDIMKAQKSFKAGEWKPKGNQPKNMYVGSKVHEKIAERYANENIGDKVFTNSIPLSSILKGGFKLNPSKLPLSTQQLELKPDILNVTKKHLYEIKPENQVANAVIERDVYMTILETAKVPVVRGPTTAPGANGVVEAPGGHAFYYSPLPGVILYRVKRGDFDPSKVPLPVGGRLPADEKEEDLEPRGSYTPGRQAPVYVREEGGVIEALEAATGLSGVALLLYFIFRTGGRIAFPPSNLIPLP